MTNVCHGGHQASDIVIECCNTTHCNADVKMFQARIQENLNQNHPGKCLTNELMNTGQ